jgi:membrane protein YdbS with pleckstrin-like domain
VYEPLKRLAVHVLRTPAGAPEPPAGSHESVAIFRASPKYLSYRMLGFWLHAVFVTLIEIFVLATSAVTGEPFVAVLAIAAAAFIGLHLLLQYFAVRLDYDLRYYIVTDRSVRVRQGVWLVREMTISHANVQNLRVVQGPIERFFGFSNLEIDTAGGGGTQSGKGASTLTGHSVRLAGIENAREVRDLVLAHLKARGRGAGLGDLDDEHAHGPSAAAAASPTLVGALRELRDATRALRAAAEGPARG